MCDPIVAPGYSGARRRLSVYGGHGSAQAPASAAPASGKAAGADAAARGRTRPARRATGRSEALPRVPRQGRPHGDPRVGPRQRGRRLEPPSTPARQGPPVFPGVARLTRVCAYDRPNTYLQTAPGRSDPVRQPQGAGRAVGDLHALLRAADIPGPYVLVAHSYGGLIARLYASTHPRQVAGLVLVDAAYELLRELFTPERVGRASRAPPWSRSPASILPWSCST